MSNKLINYIKLANGDELLASVKEKKGNLFLRNALQIQISINPMTAQVHMNLFRYVPKDFIDSEYLVVNPLAVILNQTSTQKMSDVYWGRLATIDKQMKKLKKQMKKAAQDQLGQLEENGEEEDEDAVESVQEKVSSEKEKGTGKKVTAKKSPQAPLSPLAKHLKSIGVKKEIDLNDPKISKKLKDKILEEVEADKEEIIQETGSDKSTKN